MLVKEISESVIFLSSFFAWNLFQFIEAKVVYDLFFQRLRVFGFASESLQCYLPKSPVHPLYRELIRKSLLIFYELPIQIWKLRFYNVETQTGKTTAIQRISVREIDVSRYYTATISLVMQLILYQTRS